MNTPRRRGKRTLPSSPSRARLSASISLPLPPFSRVLFTGEPTGDRSVSVLHPSSDPSVLAYQSRASLPALSLHATRAAAAAASLRHRFLAIFVLLPREAFFCSGPAYLRRSPTRGQLLARSSSFFRRAGRTFVSVGSSVRLTEAATRSHAHTYTLTRLVPSFGRLVHSCRAAARSVCPPRTTIPTSQLFRSPLAAADVATPREKTESTRRPLTVACQPLARIKRMDESADTMRHKSGRTDKTYPRISSRCDPLMSRRGECRPPAKPRPV